MIGWIVGLAVIAPTSAAQESVTYRDDRLGLAFSHPATWRMDRRRDITTFTMPLPNTTETGRLQLTRTTFRAEPALWQTVQLRANEQLRREVVRQWEQELLGVPMLMTKIRFAERGVERTILTGLLFTPSREKFNFRLEATSTSFDAAEFEWNRVLETLRTIGEQPLAGQDNTGRPPTAPTTPPRPIAPIRTPIESERRSAEPVRNSVSQELSVSGRTMVVRVPERWQFDTAEASSGSLSHPELPGPLAISLRSVVDSPLPKATLFQATAQGLRAFSVVRKREDISDRRARSGLTVNAVWRYGQQSSGNVVTFDAVVASESHYVTLQMQFAGTGDANAKRQLEALLDSLEIVPKA